ncbi:MAG: hypothetical protein JW819_11080 [Candidatus Krumholzibacteriota bacterium]|nr:hypothetical protein [Candidatus Krumholzibacteriota bacterium]
MKRLSVLVALLLATGVLLSCSEERPLAPADSDGGTEALTPFLDPEAAALALVQQAGWPVDAEARAEIDLAAGERCGLIEDFAREVIVGDIAHYKMTVRFGEGEHDRFGLHRVVKERHPFRPIRARRNLFAVHGTPGHFEVMFLFGSVTSAPDDQSIAVFLAQNDIDVWGIDQAYTLVPEAVADFGFMADWGMQFDVDNLRSGLAIARFTRLLTGSGFGTMTVMGYSTGLLTGFSALNHETQLPRWQRQIGAFIPVDNYVKTDDPDWIASESAYLQDIIAWLDAGFYANDYGLLFQTFGYLGETDPDGESPIIEGVTNLQAALIAGAQTGLLFGFPGDLHFLAGVFDDGMPVDLAYTPLVQYLEWLQGFNNYGSNLFEYDFTGIHCDQVELPFDDHLDQIDVPVFFLGAGGGWGDMMGYTASLLTGCDDVTSLTVSLTDEMLLDIGHVDIYTASDAQTLFWQPVLDWLEAH